LQLELGSCLAECRTPHRAENLEQAIQAFRSAFEILSPGDSEGLWAMAQMNLGNAYQDRILGDRADNLEQAILSYGEALRVYTRAATPARGATTGARQPFRPSVPPGRVHLHRCMRASHDSEVLYVRMRRRTRGGAIFAVWQGYSLIWGGALTYARSKAGQENCDGRIATSS
jgi:tetratricopeptide (TPR) repeat protein